MADKEHDNPANKRLAARFKKAIISGEDGKSIPQIYGEEVKKRFFVKDTLLYLVMGPLIAMNTGGLVGTILYDDSDQSKPVDAILGTQSAEGLKNGQPSYQALRIGQDIMLVVNAPQGGNNQYSVYTYDDKAQEFHYIRSESVALGHLHTIQTALRNQAGAMERGERISAADQVDFLTVSGLSALHLEEGNHYERQFTTMGPDVEADRSYAAHIAATVTHVQDALSGILTEQAYGEEATINAGVQTFESRDDYRAEAGMTGLQIYLGLLMATPLLFAGRATRRRIRGAQSQKPS